MGFSRTHRNRGRARRTQTSPYEDPVRTRPWEAQANLHEATSVARCTKLTLQDRTRFNPTSRHTGGGAGPSRRVPSPTMGEDHTGVNKDVRGTGKVTITEAATLLGVHPNTVRGRVKAGMYDAEKVATEHGLTWMIDPDSLVNEPLPRDSQHPPLQTVNPDAVNPLELVQDLLRPFVEDLGRVREELGAERVRREQAELERDDLRRQLEALRGPPQAPQTVPECPEGGELRSDTAGPQTGIQEPGGVDEEPTDTPRRPWWLRWLGG